MRSKISVSFNSNPTALIDTQWINNVLTSYLAAPSSYILRCTGKSVIAWGEKYTSTISWQS